MKADDIAEYAYNAGIRNQADLQAAVAIALAESSGNPRAYNGRGRDQSYGLWQINMKPSEVGDRKKELGIATNEALYDPAVNAAAMFKISRGGKDWSPWSTWPLEASVQMFIAIPTATGTLAKKRVTGNTTDVGTSITDAVNPEALVPDGLVAVGDAVSATSDWVTNRENWFRVAKVLIGGVLIVGGVFLIAKPLATNVAASEIGKLAGKATKGGK